jgi:K+-transporting ATPase ATPase C chain
MIRHLRPALSLLILFTLLLGIAYPLAVTGIAQIAFPTQANGSLVIEGDRIVGSSLIGQSFTGATHFHSRPSAAGDGYDASASSASNLAPGSQDLRDRIAGDVEKLRTEGLTGDNVPPDLVTTSASGLDPHISPEAAFAQAQRVAMARGMPVETVNALIASHVDESLLGFIGQRRVNLLALNMALDASGANRQPPPVAAKRAP